MCGKPMKQMQKMVRFCGFLGLRVATCEVENQGNLSIFCMKSIIYKGGWQDSFKLVDFAHLLWPIVDAERHTLILQFDPPN